MEALTEFFIEDPRESGGRKDPEFFQGVLEDPFLQDLARDLNVVLDPKTLLLEIGIGAKR